MIKKILFFVLFYSIKLIAASDSLNVSLHQQNKNFDWTPVFSVIGAIIVVFIGAYFNNRSLNKTLSNQYNLSEKTFQHQRDVEQAKIDVETNRKYIEYISNNGSIISKCVHALYDISAERTQLKLLYNSLSAKDNIKTDNRLRELVLKTLQDLDLNTNKMFNLSSEFMRNLNLISLNISIEDRNNTKINEVINLFNKAWTDYIYLHKNDIPEDEKVINDRLIKRKEIDDLANNFTSILTDINDNKRNEIKKILQTNK